MEHYARNRCSGTGICPTIVTSTTFNLYFHTCLPSQKKKQPESMDFCPQTKKKRPALARSVLLVHDLILAPPRKRFLFAGSKMPRYYCDYCDVFLTHDSPSVRKQHNRYYSIGPKSMVLVRACLCTRHVKGSS